MNKDEIDALREKYKRQNKYMTLLERFWFCVDAGSEDECWEWRGAKTDKGYGNITIEGKSVGAHRASWIIHYRYIPGELHVLHRCDNKSCVNPKHLFLGTNWDNVQDKTKKNRHYKGTDVWQSKLIEDDVRKIKNLYSTGNYSHRKLASIFGLQNHGTVGKIIRGDAWKHVK